MVIEKTIQIGLRLELNLLKRIEKLASLEGIDKMSWIRRALATFLSDEEEGFVDKAIDDFIHLRIDEREFREYTEMKSIPNDIKNARDKVLETITKKELSK